MPNHLHAIIVIGGAHQYSPDPAALPAADSVRPQSGSLSAILRSFKAGVTYRCRALEIVNFAWQAGFHDHILRGNAAVNAVRDYIEKNPAHWEEDQENPQMVVRPANRIVANP
jgi:putative transposase